MSNNVKTIFQWLNNDSTADLNKRFATVFYKGITSGGTLSSVPLKLDIIVSPYEAMTESGLMLVSEVDYTFTNIPLNQMTVLTIFGKWMRGDESIVEYRMYEINEFNSLSNKGDHVVFGAVTLGSSNIQTTDADLSYDLRDVFDKIGRGSIRGSLINATELPALNNRENDLYIVGGSGGLVEIYAWNGTAWLNITNSLSFQDELTNHKNNACQNEKHLSDDEKDAILGTSGIPSNSNRLVTNQDTRIPTQKENDALVGSDGEASASNKYVTQEYSIAETNYLIYPLAPGTMSLLSITGKYVGNGGIDSANSYFSLLDIGIDRGYINSSGLFPKVVGVWKDPLLTSKLNPSVDAVGGFYDGDLYITVDNVIDTGVRLAYGQKRDLKNIDRGFNLRKGPSADWVSGEARQHIQDIKGRDYDELIPEDEKNINLRKDIYELISYIGSNQDISIVSDKKDFEYFKSNQELSKYFVENENVSYVYKYSNTGLNSFTYNSSTGTITYSGSPNLANVVSGNLFRDGLGNLYKVIGKTTNTLNVVDITTNLIPLSINTSVSGNSDGAVIVNNNPRNILTNGLKAYANEVILFDNLVEIEELSIPEGRQAFGVVQDSKRINPNIVLYGSWENISVNGCSYVANYNGIGDIQITGFLSEVYLLCKQTNSSPSLGVSLNCEQISSVVDVNNGGLLNSDIIAAGGYRYSKVLIKNEINSSSLTTVNMRIQSATSEPLIVYGMEIVTFPSINNTVSNEVLIEGGVGFKSTKVVKKSLNEVVQIPAINKFGVNYQVTIDRDSNNNSVYNVVNTPTPEIDYYPSYPTSVGYNGSSYVVTDQKAKIFRINDIIQLIGANSVDIRKLSAISGSTYTFDKPAYGENKQFRLLCSLGDDTPFESYNNYAAKYNIVKEFVDGSTTDFNTKDAAFRYVAHKDGQTILGAKNATSDGGILTIAQTTGSLDIGVFGPKMAINFNNSTSVTIQVSIDGSDYFDITIPSGKVRKTIFSKGRNTFHEVHIRSLTKSFSVTDLILFTIDRGDYGDASLLATIDNVSPYYQSLLNDEVKYRYSSGKLFKDALQHGTFINGSDTNSKWSINNVNQFLGRCVSTQNGGDTFNFSFIGEGFDIYCLVGPDCGKCKVFVDGLSWNIIAGTTLIGSSDSYIDAYNSTQGAKIFTMFGLPYKTHNVSVVMDNPRSKNASSIGYNFGVFGYSVLSINGKLRNTYNNISNVYTPIWDNRLFSSVVSSNSSSSSSSGSSSNVVANITTTFYLHVDQAFGEDSSDSGSIAKPFKSIDAALSYAKANVSSTKNFHIKINPNANNYFMSPAVFANGDWTNKVGGATSIVIEGSKNLTRISTSDFIIDGSVVSMTLKDLVFNVDNFGLLEKSTTTLNNFQLIIDGCSFNCTNMFKLDSNLSSSSSISLINSNFYAPPGIYIRDNIRATNCTFTSVTNVYGICSFNSCYITYLNAYNKTNSGNITTKITSIGSVVNGVNPVNVSGSTTQATLVGDSLFFKNAPSYSTLTAESKTQWAYEYIEDARFINVRPFGDFGLEPLQDVLTKMYSRATVNLAAYQTKPGIYTFVASDANTTVASTATVANTFTVPTSATADIPLYSSIAIMQEGAGQLSIAAASGVTILTEVGLKLNAQNAMATLYKVGANKWILTGSLKA